MTECDYHILLIEDDEDDACLFRRMLADASEAKFSVVHAAGLEDGVKLLDDSASRFAVLALRLSLPVGSGLEGFFEARRATPHLPIVLLSDLDDEHLAVSAVRAGAQDYLIKGQFGSALLVRALRFAIERTRTDDSVRSGEERFRLLVESVTDYAIFMLDQAGYVTSWNLGAKQIYGYAPDEIIGQHYSRFFTVVEFQNGGPGRELRIAEQDGRYSGEAERVCKDGSQFLAHVVTMALYDASGWLCGFSKVTRDITELRRNQDRLLQAERLVAMAEAMAGLAHESRNALQRSQASLERLTRRLKDQPQALELIGNIQQAQDDLHHLYEDVREFAKPIRIRTERHDIHEVLRDAWRQLARTRKGRRAKLREQSAGVELECEIDAFAVQQVFRNILDNSLAAREDAVEIDIHYSAATLGDRPALRIAFRDNGPGLDQQQQEKIFDPFYTTKTHGTGLGMAIAHRIVETHGGQIAAKQGKHQGAEILVTLPRRQE